MSGTELPRRAEELIKCFVGLPDRVQYYLDAVEADARASEYITWVSQLCAPTYEDVVTLTEDPANAYAHPSFVRLLYRDDTFKDLRDRNVRLVNALEAQSPRPVVNEFLNYLTELSAEDRARSFLLLASEIPASESDQEEDEERIEWLTRIVASFTTSPRALRPQLLLAASIIGHTPMVTLLLRDIAVDDDPAPNIDAVEAECLIEAAVNQHFQIVKELLAGGRFSNGNETRWDAVVQALEVSCANGAADITDVLLPHYLSYCSVISSCGVHHPRLLRLALSNWHFEIVEMLLECDPRGTLCNMMELIDTLREEVAQSAQDDDDEEEVAASSGMLSVVVGEENDDMGDVITWDAAALARGVSSGNTTLVKFLVNHVGFCPEALEAAVETAREAANSELVEIISTPLEKMRAEQEEEDDEVDDSPSSHDAINDEPPVAAQVEQLQKDPTSGDGEDVPILPELSLNVSHPRLEQEGGGQEEENEEDDGEEDGELDTSPCAGDLINDEIPAVALTDSGKRLQTGYQDRASDDCEDATNLTEVPPDVSRPRSAAKLMAARATSFKEVEHMIATATQSVVTKATKTAHHDDMLRNSTEDEEAAAERAEDNLLGHSTEFDEAEAESAESELVENYTNVQGVETNDALTGLQPLDDTRSAAKMVLLRQFSSDTVDRAMRDGKLSAMQHEAQKQTETSTAKQARDEPPDEDVAVKTPEAESFNHVSTAAGGDTPVSRVDCEEGAALVERESSGNRHTVPCEIPAGVDAAMIDEGVVPQATSVGSGDNLSKDQENHSVSVENATCEMLEQAHGAEVPAPESSPIPMFPPTIVIPSCELLSPTGERETVDDKPELMYSWGAEPHKNDAVQRPSTQSRQSKSQVVAPPVRTPTASPTRSTIVCPVQWIERTAETSESSVVDVASSVPLHEGDRVEVHYKGRPFLFPGVVIFCHSSGVYDVRYEDGEEETCVPRELIQLVESSQKPNGSNAEEDSHADPEDVIRDVQLDAVGSTEPASPNEDSIGDRTWGGEDNGSSSTATPTIGALNNQLIANDGSNADSEHGGSGLSGLPAFDRQCQGAQPEQASSSVRSNPPDDNGPTDKRLEPEINVNHDSASSTPAPIANNKPSVSEADEEVEDNVVEVEHLPEIPSLIVPNAAPLISGKEIMNEIRLASAASGRSSRDRGLSFASQRSRCRTADAVSSEDVAEWKNVDLLLNRKRRLFQTQTGSIESIKVPWGEEFATIQSLKRFAAQHPDVLRAHIEAQLQELEGPLASTSPRKPRSPRSRNSSAHSGAGQARGSLLLIKDLAFLLQHRLAPFFDAIVPVVMPTVFHSEKRFLCETATEVLDAIVLHCSGRKLALLLLQLGEGYSKHEDLHLHNLASIYVEKCVRNWSKSELGSLSAHSSQSSTQLLTLLAKTLTSKTAPVRISAQKTFRHLRDELGKRDFEAVLRTHLPADLERLVLKECGGATAAAAVPSGRKSSKRQHERGGDSHSSAATTSHTIVQNSPSILQRMLLHRQNRVLPTQT